jgi:hypothetical protein
MIPVNQIAEGVWGIIGLNTIHEKGELDGFPLIRGTKIVAKSCP